MLLEPAAAMEKPLPCPPESLPPPSGPEPASCLPNIFLMLSQPLAIFEGASLTASLTLPAVLARELRAGVTLTTPRVMDCNSAWPKLSASSTVGLPMSPAFWVASSCCFFSSLPLTTAPAMAKAPLCPELSACTSSRLAFQMPLPLASSPWPITEGRQLRLLPTSASTSVVSTLSASPPPKPAPAPKATAPDAVHRPRRCSACTPTRPASTLAVLWMEALTVEVRVLATAVPLAAALTPDPAEGLMARIRSSCSAWTWTPPALTTDCAPMPATALLETVCTLSAPPRAVGLPSEGDAASPPTLVPNRNMPILPAIASCPSWLPAATVMGCAQSQRRSLAMALSGMSWPLPSRRSASWASGLLCQGCSPVVSASRRTLSPTQARVSTRLVSTETEPVIASSSEVPWELAYCVENLPARSLGQPERLIIRLPMSLSELQRSKPFRLSGWM